MMVGQMLGSPERRLPEMRAFAEARLAEAANAIGDNFGAVFDVPILRTLAEGFRNIGADEGTLWLLDELRDHLIPRYNSGPRAVEFVNQFRQNLRSGMISMVVATEQPICENAMATNKRQDRTLDARLGLQTTAMIAVPLYFAGEVRGVLSGVQLRPSGAADPEGVECAFTAKHLHALQHTAVVISRLVEHRLLQLCLGLQA